MMRSLIAVMAGLAFFAGAVRAEEETREVKGLVKQYDVKQGILKVKVGQGEQTFKVRADTRFVDQNGKPLDADSQVEQVTAGAQVTLVTQKQGGKQGPQQVSRVQVQVIKIKKKPEPKPEQSKPEQKKDDR